MTIRSLPVALIGLLVVAASCGGDTIPKVPLVHRVTSPSCATPPPAGNCGLSPNTNNIASSGACALDSDCTGVNARCTGPFFGMCSCTHDECGGDADCATDQTCDCREARLYEPTQANYCLPSNCRVDSDCGANGYCSPSHDIECGLDGERGWYCHTKKDRCTNDSDCPISDENDVESFCGFDPTLGYWRCAQTTCVH